MLLFHVALKKCVKDSECYTKSLFIVQDYRLYIAGANNSVYPNCVYKVVSKIHLLHVFYLKKPYHKIILECRVQFSFYLWASDKFSTSLCDGVDKQIHSQPQCSIYIQTMFWMEMHSCTGGNLTGFVYKIG